MELVTSLSATEAPTEAPAKPNVIAPEPTSDWIVAVSDADSVTDPATVIVLLAAALAPLRKVSIVLWIVFVELAPAPEKLRLAIEMAAETVAATDRASAVALAVAASSML